MVSGDFQETPKEGEADIMGTGGLSRSSALSDSALSPHGFVNLILLSWQSASF